MKTTLHRAAERGRGEHGWLHSRHSFSFAGYHNPERMGFGKLRVINDDLVVPSMGFGTHAHDNMEIISVPLSGALRHTDSMGHTRVIRPDEVQVMSAGTGITHSEHNDSTQEPVSFLQIWVQPKRLHVTPRYNQRRFDPEERRDRLQLVVSPDGRDGSLHINQDAYFSRADLSAGASLDYTLHEPDNGLYLFVIDGWLTVAEQRLGSRDALGIEGSATTGIAAATKSRLLAIEVPMG